MQKIIIFIFLLFVNNNIINAEITKEELDKILDELNQDPVMQALMNNDYDKMRSTIRNRADANWALWRAVLISDYIHFGNTQMVEMLLKEFKA